MVYWGVCLLFVLMILCFFVNFPDEALCVSIFVGILWIIKSLYLTHKSKIYKNFKYTVVSGMILGFFMCSTSIFWNQEPQTDLASLKCDNIINFTNKNKTIDFTSNGLGVFIGKLQVSSNSNICLNIAHLDRGFIVKQKTTIDWN